MSGSGAVILTGHLGDILKESAQTAVSFVRTHCITLGIDQDRLQNADIHIHVPASSIPKDGPSAGLAMSLSLISHLRDQLILPDIAMTGEITLTGQILGVGAIRDKLLAAQRALLGHILLPLANRQEVNAMPRAVRAGLRLTYVGTILQAHNIIFKGSPKGGR
jgi:ATP-dependent Lon protease